MRNASRVVLEEMGMHAGTLVRRRWGSRKHIVIVADVAFEGRLCTRLEKAVIANLASSPLSCILLALNGRLERCDGRRSHDTGRHAEHQPIVHLPAIQRRVVVQQQLFGDAILLCDRVAVIVASGSVN